MQRHRAALGKSGNINILRFNPALHFLGNQRINRSLRSADTRAVWPGSNIGGENVIPGAHHISAIYRDRLLRRMRKQITHSLGQMYFFCNRDKVLAIRPQAMQPDDAMAWRGAGFKRNVWKNAIHGLRCRGFLQWVQVLVQAGFRAMPEKSRGSFSAA